MRSSPERRPSAQRLKPAHQRTHGRESEHYLDWDELTCITVRRMGYPSIFNRRMASLAKKKDHCKQDYENFPSKSRSTWCRVAIPAQVRLR